VSLAYDEGRENKVCDDCFAVLQPDNETSAGELTVHRKAPGVLQVSCMSHIMTDV